MLPAGSPVCPVYEYYKFFTLRDNFCKEGKRLQVLSEILGQFSMSSSEEVDRFNGQ
jgi:hypothetical protein